MNDQDRSGGRPPWDATITLHGRPIQLRYRAGVGRDVESRAALARAEKAWWADERYAMELYRRLAVQCIEAWDLELDDGQPAPIVERALEGLPIRALERIIREATGVGRRSRGE